MKHFVITLVMQFPPTVSYIFKLENLDKGLFELRVGQGIAERVERAVHIAQPVRELVQPDVDLVVFVARCAEAVY